MKIRTGFVSNSSSSSFAIIKKELTEEQKKELLEYSKSEENEDGWNITEEEFFIRGYTIMDNNSISELFKKLTISPEIIQYNTES
jgi:hypothetical protein